MCVTQVNCYKKSGLDFGQKSHYIESMETTLPRSRCEAILKASKFYFTNRPCMHGHLSKRLTVSGACCTCMLDHHNKWRKSNLDKVRAYQQAWQRAHKVQVNRSSQKWQRNNKEHLAIYRKNRAPITRVVQKVKSLYHNFVKKTHRIISASKIAKGQLPKGLPTISSLLGCSITYFKNHLNGAISALYMIDPYAAEPYHYTNLRGVPCNQSIQSQAIRV